MGSLPGRNSPWSLAGRCVVVGGATGFLGRAITRGIADAGATVFGCARSESALEVLDAEFEKESDLGIQLHAADIDSETGIAQLLDRAEDVCGRIDGWINCAVDVHEVPGPVQERANVKLTLDAILATAIMTTQTVASRMAKTGGGSIVNMGSIYGLVSPYLDVYRDAPGQHNPPGYGAAKAGILQYTRYAACHFAPMNVRVNSLTPGPFPDPSKSSASPAFLAELARRVPLARVGSPDELIAPAVFLLSSASSFVTGHDLVVDGGWTAW